MPYDVRPARERRAGLDPRLPAHDRGRLAGSISLKSKRPFEEAFGRVWLGEIENDGFNRLVLRPGSSAREVTVLRAYCKYLRQAGIAFSQAYMERRLARNPAIARRLVRPVPHPVRPGPAGRLRASAPRPLVSEIESLLDQVANLDEDRILRRYLNLIAATLRTNYFQTGADGEPKPYLSLKLDSQARRGAAAAAAAARDLRLRPRVEAIHLRGGKVARGGIRWSDRREDFRTEILGLMKAQMVKNAVIVPVGSKGGFVVKRPPGRAAARRMLRRRRSSATRSSCAACSTSPTTCAASEVVPPPDVVRHDDDDPYLVVAADKGTATFSDIANGVAADYGFWLGDAFASGGSAGYDHKEMGITARGAWESVKRHFRELGSDIQAQDFTVVGVGDMSGDVFGNGMLLSPHIRLLAAFDHRHIFIDPDPDPARSFAERKRLFDLPRSSWADYDARADLARAAASSSAAPRRSGCRREMRAALRHRGRAR